MMPEKSDVTVRNSTKSAEEVEMRKNNAQKTTTNGVQTWASVVTGNKLASRGMT